jgi:hypothetical protein
MLSCDKFVLESSAEGGKYGWGGRANQGMRLPVPHGAIPRAIPLSGLSPFQDPVVYVFSIYDPHDPNLLLNHFKDNPVIPNP